MFNDRENHQRILFQEEVELEIYLALDSYKRLPEVKHSILQKQVFPSYHNVFPIDPNRTERYKNQGIYAYDEKFIETKYKEKLLSKAIDEIKQRIEDKAKMEQRRESNFQDGENLKTLYKRLKDDSLKDDSKGSKDDLVDDSLKILQELFTTENDSFIYLIVEQEDLLEKRERVNFLRDCRSYLNEKLILTFPEARAEYELFKAFAKARIDVKNLKLKINISEFENVQNGLELKPLLNYLEEYRDLMLIQNLVEAIKNLSNDQLYDPRQLQAALKLYKKKEPIKPAFKKVLNVEVPEIIEVKCTEANMSEIVSKVEILVKKEEENRKNTNDKKETALTNFKELHVFAAEKIVIDCNLGNNIWHGKNIAIIASNIEIIEKCTWDVSGKDGHKFSEGLPNSKDGRHGSPGESSGNITLFAHVFSEDNGELNLIMHGGNGKDGENGKRGANGRSIKINEDYFKKEYPVEDLLYNPEKIAKKILSNNDEKIIDWEESDGLNTKAGQFHKLNRFCAIIWKNMRFRFSYSYNESISSFPEIFFLIQSELQLGQQGGKAGKGGYGGYAGVASILSSNKYENICRMVIPYIRIKAVNGEKGKDGKNGSPGKHNIGSDIGYIIKNGNDKLIGGRDKKISYDLAEKEEGQNIFCAYYNNSNRTQRFAQIKEISKNKFMKLHKRDFLIDNLLKANLLKGIAGSMEGIYAIHQNPISLNKIISSYKLYLKDVGLESDFMLLDIGIRIKSELLQSHGISSCISGSSIMAETTSAVINVNYFKNLPMLNEKIIAIRDTRYEILKERQINRDSIIKEAEITCELRASTHVLKKYLTEEFPRDDIQFVSNILENSLVNIEGVKEHQSKLKQRKKVAKSSTEEQENKKLNKYLQAMFKKKMEVDGWKHDKRIELDTSGLLHILKEEVRPNFMGILPLDISSSRIADIYDQLATIYDLIKASTYEKKLNARLAMYLTFIEEEYYMDFEKQYRESINKLIGQRSKIKEIFLEQMDKNSWKEAIKETVRRNFYS